MQWPDQFDRVFARLEKLRQVGERWEACCPAHEDSSPSLTAKVTEDGKLLLKCHRGNGCGCTIQAIVSALGLKMTDLFPATGQRQPLKIEASYNYVDEHKHLLFQVVRLEGKKFRQRRPDGRRWKWGIEGVRRVLYRLPELLAVPLDQPVAVVEGEKDTDNCWLEGIPATTSPMGAERWQPEYNAAFWGRKVVVVADNDGEKQKFAGQKHAECIAWNLYGVAQGVKVIQMPGAKDFSAWRDGKDVKRRFWEIVRAAPRWNPSHPLSDFEIAVRCAAKAMEKATDQELQGVLKSDKLVEVAAAAGVLSSRKAK